MATRRAFLATLGTLSLGGCTTQRQAGEVSPQSTPTSTTASPESAEPSEESPSPTSTADPEPPDSVDAEWPMPAYDPGRSNYTPETRGPTGRIADLWSVSMDASLSGPVLADGTLYVGGDDGVVRALDARTGEERWRESVGAPAGTPWAMDDRLFVPTTESIVTLGAHDGAPGWRIETPDRRGFLLAHHGVYYLSDGGDASVIGLDRSDGSERWRSDIADPWTSTLFASDEHVFVSTGSNAQVPWVFAADTGEFRGERRPQRGADFAAEQFYLEGTIVAGDGFFGNVRADTVSSDGYGTRWRTGVDAYSGFGLSGGVESLYFHANAGDVPGLYSLSLADGRQEWHAEGVERIVGRPVVADDAVVVSTETELRCFDPTDGAERWSYPSDDIGRQFVLADDLVYTTQASTVRAFRVQE